MGLRTFDDPSEKCGVLCALRAAGEKQRGHWYRQEPFHSQQEDLGKVGSNGFSSVMRASSLCVVCSEGARANTNAADRWLNVEAKRLA
jgi:hypothetical protein